MRGEHEVGKGKRLTWVAGDRPVGEMDEASRKNLAAGRKAHTVATDTLMVMAGGESASHQSGTSIFDPVLCELTYRWFSGEGASVLDPFAGGSVRGIVAAKLNRNYTGCDLRAEQIAANVEQAQRITPERLPRWIVGDSLEIEAHAQGEYDLVFSCPPYADLEVYSDNPQDLSTMPYAHFLDAYRRIIRACVAMLKPDRFACFVVGDVRDKKGICRNFVSDTIAAFQDAGAKLYNEAILVTSVGSLPIRVGKQFESGRKLGKTHQNVLVFIKGDPKKATAACGKVEVYDPADQFGEVVTDDVA
jgi:DNA modification methylase